jgi:tetratricopeptide (TPR) repeat protein
MTCQRNGLAYLGGMKQQTNLRPKARTFLLWGSLFLLVSCATDTLRSGDAGRTTESAYGNYLAARYASGMNDVHAAAKYYAAAMDKAPQNLLLKKQAFLSTMLAGKIAQSAAIARPQLNTEGEARLMRLVVAADELGNQEYALASETLSSGKYGPFNGEMRQLLWGWAAFGTKDTDTAIALIKSASDAPAFARIAQFNLALMYDLAGRNTEAEAAYKIATDKAHLSDRSAYAYGAFLERFGRADEAKSLYETAISVFLETPLSTFALSRLDKAPKSPPDRLVKNAGEGAAEALFGTAQILTAKAHFDKALVYLEMAHFISPKQEAVLQLLGRLMEVEKRPEDALRTYASVEPGSPYRAIANLYRARTLFGINRREEALVIFRELSLSNPDDDRLTGAYADALRSMRQYEKALPIYEKLIARQDGKAGWQLYFARGTVLERLGRWRDSVADFRKALKINPDQSEVLNYLGYTYIDAGENLEEGLALIEKAESLRPDAGHIVDSLGWAHYRLGNYQKAVRYLERAIELEPSEPTISDHLADAYWQAGRRLEARFQWSHTLSLEPDDDIDFAEVKEKLAHGLRDKPEIASATP